MKKELLAAFLVCTSPLLGFAEDAPARPEIEELFTVMRVEQQMNTAMEHMKQMLPKMTADMAKRSNVTASDTAQVQKAQVKAFEMLQKELSWATLKPEFTKIYADIFTPDEVKAITAFFKTPAGQNFLNKQPELMKKTMTLTQGKTMQMMPKIQALVQAGLEADKKAAPSESAAPAAK